MSSRDSITPPVSGKQADLSRPTVTVATEQQEQQTQQGEEKQHKNPSPTRKKRVRNWSAEDRAAHRIFERSRREAFKGRLTKLAALIPSLRATDPSRLSKHVVIDESISLHYDQQQQLEAVQRQVNCLLAERDDLLTEMNQWRTQAGMPHAEARPLEPLPEPSSAQAGRPSASRSGSIAEQPVIEEEPIAEAQNQPVSAQSQQQQPPQPQQQKQRHRPPPPQQQVDAMQRYEALPTHMQGMETQGIAPPQPPGWDVMGMNINTQGMPPPENNMAFTDMFPSDMVNYQTSVKMEGSMEPGSYVPAGFQQAPMNQSSMSMMNPVFAGDPRTYGQ